MRLMFVSDVSRMMNAPAGALSAMTLLALEAFTAGLHIQAWNICVIGFELAIGIPAIAWLEQSALFLLLVALVIAAVIGPLFWHHKKQNKDRPLPSE
jgi:membrane protein implicated in regulation of membrane protease activity